MATVNGATYNEAVQSIAQNPEKYSAIGDLLNAAASGVNELGKPDVSELLVETYGDQGTTGFLKLTGAVSSAGASIRLNFTKWVVVTDA